MKKINDYATKNHLNEWEIKDLPKCDVYRLDLPNGDLSILFYLTNIKQLVQSKIFIPSLPNNDKIMNNVSNMFYRGFPDNKHPKIYTLDNSLCNDFHVMNISSVIIQNITPDWSKYIAEGNVVLFLSEEDGKKYSRAMGLNWFYWLNKDSIDSRLNWNLWINKYPIDRHFRTENTFFDFKKEEARLKEYYNLPKESKKISIILPSIHSQNIQEISNIAKDLKENYGVEYVEIVTLDCYLKNLYTEYRIRFYRNIDFKKYRDVNTDISIIMKNIENDLDEYLYIYNFTEAEETLSNYEEFQKDNLESMSQKQDIAMTYKEDFSIIPNDTKVIIMNDIKESLIEFINDNKNEYKQIKEYFNISSQISFYDKKNIDKIITTDSTGVLEVQDTKHLQVIDCQEFFNN